MKEAWIERRYMMPPVDVFALRVTLYWLMTGYYPFCMHDDAWSKAGSVSKPERTACGGFTAAGERGDVAKMVARVHLRHLHSTFTQALCIYCSLLPVDCRAFFSVAAFIMGPVRLGLKCNPHQLSHYAPPATFLLLSVVRLPGSLCASV